MRYSATLEITQSPYNKSVAPNFTMQYIKGILFTPAALGRTPEKEINCSRLPHNLPYLLLEGERYTVDIETEDEEIYITNIQPV
jgi:hypothetical protein